MSDKLAGDLVAILFLARDLAHREHLKTTSHARHAALNSFYDEIVGLADSFAETYQGKYDCTLEIPLAENEFGEDIVAVLEAHEAWIEANRTDVCSYTPLQNILDEVQALYCSTLYKLRRLK